MKIGDLIKPRRSRPWRRRVIGETDIVVPSSIGIVVSRIEANVVKVLLDTGETTEEVTKYWELIQI